ncbi:MAG: oxalate---CoA ligase [Microbacteriaceae bacterium]|nr:oxalate---CoA ligase [Microbacteriaceae bacterium]
MKVEPLATLINRRAAESPHASYLEDARSDRSLDYAGFAEAVSAWRVLLDDLEVPGAGGVLVDLADPLSFAVVHLAVVAAGRRSVPVDPDLPWADVMRLSGLLGGAALLVSDRAERPDVTEFDVAAVAPANLMPAGLVRAVQGRPEAERSNDGGPAAQTSVEGSTLLFTSGSTGQPKGVELPESQLLFVANAIARNNGLSPDDRGYNPLPLFHVNAEVVGLLSTLVAGATLVLDRRFHRTGFWELLSKRRITWLNAVPSMLAVLARSGDIVPPAGLRFIRSASAPLPDAVRAAFSGIPLIVSYGMTEGASQITATPLGEPARPGSVGVPLGGEVQVRDEGGKLLPPGEIGALWLRGPGIIAQYFLGRAPERFDADGWLATGDLGYVDDDGYVYLVGRSDDVINRGGEKVYPAEVEDILLKDARVREAVVVARPDPILGHVPVAYVIPPSVGLLQSEVVELIDALRDRCERELPRFKRPVDIRMIADLPRAATGKVQRSRVRLLAAADAGAAA